MMDVNSLDPRPSMLRPRTVFLLTLAASAAFLFPTNFWPFDYDQGTFAYGGWAILHGARPYIDFWDIKPPNIFYTYAAAFSLFGNSVRAVRIFDYLNALLSIALLYLLSIRSWKDSVSKHTAAILAVLAFGCQYYIFGHWDTAQVETYSVPFLLAAMLLVIPTHESSSGPKLYSRAALAGAAIGVTFYFKFPDALFLVAAALALWFHSPPERRTRGIAQVWLAAGFLAVVVLQSLYLALAHEFLPLWHITTSSTEAYVSNNYSGSFTAIQNLRTAVQVLGTAFVIFGAIGWIVLARSRANARMSREVSKNAFGPTLAILIVASLIALIIVQAQNKGYTYHYAVLLPWADILIGGGLSSLPHAFWRWNKISEWENALFLAVLLVVISYFWLSKHPLQERAEELYRIASGSEAPNGYIAGDTIANYVLEHSDSNDRIFIFGFQPYVYWKSGRAPATKFLNTIHFKPARVPNEEREELLHTLLGNPPRLFLVEMGDRYTSQGNTNDDSRTTIRQRYPELEQLLQTQYRPIDTLQQTIVYQRLP